MTSITVTAELVTWDSFEQPPRHDDALRTLSAAIGSAAANTNEEDG